MTPSSRFPGTVPVSSLCANKRGSCPPMQLPPPPPLPAPRRLPAGGKPSNLTMTNSSSERDAEASDVQEAVGVDENEISVELSGSADDAVEAISSEEEADATGEGSDEGRDRSATQLSQSKSIALQQFLPPDLRLRAPSTTNSMRSRPPSPSLVSLTRNDSAQSISSASTVVERKRSHPGRPGKPPTDERTGFARIYFENQSFTSSTVFKLTATTTVLEVRKSMANKIKIPSAEFAFYVIVVVYPSDTSVRSLSGRTLQDEELVLPIVEKLNRVRTNTADGEDSLGPLRPKAKHRTRPPLKFILKDVRGAPLDLEEEYMKKETSESQGLIFPAFLGKGIRSGYLQKASVKDPNVWRKRWFVVKDDQLLYCKSATNQRDVTTISLLSAYLAKAKPDVKVAFSFELRTPRREYHLCASNKEEMVAWIHALHIQIGICGENHRLYEAEIIITEDAVSRNEEEEAITTPLSEPSLLQRVLARKELLKSFSDFMYSIGAQALLNAWLECELFRQRCIQRENGIVNADERMRTPKDEWEHLKTIVRMTEALPMIRPNEVAQLRQSFQSQQLSRRLSIALHSDSSTDYPRVELIASVHQNIFQAIESGPFKLYLARRGYRAVLQCVMGRIG